VANHPSALKRARQNQKRKIRNSILRSKVRTTERTLRESIENNDSQKIKPNLIAAIAEISRARNKDILHKKTASRKIARLSRKVHLITAKKS
jgi:small subunit ribosomal protein S20